MSATTLPPKTNGNGNGHHAVAVLHDEPVSILNIIAALAARDNPNVDALDRLMAAQERYENRENERLFNQAFAKMWPKLPRVARKGEVDTGKGKFKVAREEDVDEAARPIMDEYGFAFSFRPVEQDVVTGRLTMEGSLIHVDTGYAKTARMSHLPDTGPGRNAIQSMGSAQTYLIKYLKSALLAIVREVDDDDGNGAGGKDQYKGYRQSDQKTKTRETETDDRPDRPPVDRVARTVDLLDKARSAEAWITTLTSAIGGAPSATELNQLRNRLRKMIDGLQNRDAKRDAIKAFENQLAEFGKEPLSADEQWAEDQISALAGIWDMDSFLLMANDLATQKKMQGFSTTNPELYNRVKAAYGTTRERIAKAAVQ